MAPGLILSYDNDPALHAIPDNIARKLKNYHVLAIRYLYGRFYKKQNGVILNEEYGMDFPLQIVSFLSSFKVDTLEAPILVISAENNLGLWKQYISDYTELPVVSLSDHDEDMANTHARIILGSDAEFRKAVTLKDFDYFMVVIEGLEKVITMRAIKGLQGNFNIGFTLKNFYKERNLKLMWQMLKWVEPSIGKFNDFSMEYNDCLLNIIEPFPEFWYRVTWNFSNCFEKPSSLEDFDLNTTKQKSVEKKPTTPKSRKSNKPNSSKTSNPKKRRSNEDGRNTSLKKHCSNLNEKNSSLSDNLSTPLYTSYNSTTAVSEDDESGTMCTLQSLRKEKESNVHSTGNISFPESRDYSPRNPSGKEQECRGNSLKEKENGLKRKSSDKYMDQADSQGSDYSEIIITKDKTIKISPKKETYFCNTLKCSPQKKKRRLNFGTPTPRSVIDVFEQYYEKNIDTDNISEKVDNEEKSPPNDFSLSLESSPKSTAEIDNEIDFPDKVKLPSNDIENTNNDFVLHKINHNNVLINDSNQLLNEAENKNNKPTLKRNVEIYSNSSLTEVIEGDSKVIHQESIQTMNYLTEDNSTLNQPSTSTKALVSVIKKKVIQDPFQVQASTSKNWKTDQNLITKNKQFLPPKQKQLSIIEAKKNAHSSNTKVEKKGKTLCKYKSSYAMMETITDEAVVKEFSNEFFESNQETLKFLRKTKSDTNLAPKTKIIDKHVLEEFAKDFQINSFQGNKFFDSSFILRNVKENLKGGLDKSKNKDDGNSEVIECTHCSTSTDSPENIWSLFRKSEPKSKNNTNDVKSKIGATEVAKDSLWNDETKSLGISSVFEVTDPLNEECIETVEIISKQNHGGKDNSQDTENINENQLDCLNCSGQEGVRIELCNKCKCITKKVNKGTQFDLDELLGLKSNRNNDMSAIVNSCDSTVLPVVIEKDGAKDKVSLANFYGDRKQTIYRMVSKEEVLSSLFDDEIEQDGNNSCIKTLFNEDNDLEIWSLSMQEEKSKQVRSEILNSLFGE